MYQMLNTRPGTNKRSFNFWKRIKQAFAGSNSIVQPTVNEFATAYMPRSRYNYKREVGTGYGNSIVMATLFWIARNFTSGIPRVYDTDKNGNLVVVPQHDFYNLIRRPNPYYSGILLWYATAIEFAALGNAYWQIVFSGAKRSVELWWIPSSLIEPKWDKSGDNYLTHYEYKPNPMKDPIRLEIEEVLHFRYGLDPNNSRKGLSPLASVIREVFTDDEAANFSAAMVRNMGVPGIIISPDEDVELSAEDAESNKAVFMEKFTGDRRGEPMFLSTKAKVEKVSFSPKDMELTAMRRIPEERITAVTGIPAVVVGVGAGLDRMIYNNMSEAKESAYENGIMPIQELLAAELATQLLPRMSGYKESYIIKFDVSQVRVLQEDNTKLVERLNTQLAAGAITIAEWRAAQGMEVLPEHEVYLRPNNVVTIPAGVLPDELFALDSGLPDVSTAAIIIDAKFKELKTTRVQRSLVRQLTRDAAKLSDEFADDLQDMFSEISDDVTRIMRAMIEQKSLVYAGTTSNGHQNGKETKAVEEWPELWQEMLVTEEVINRVLNQIPMESMIGDVYASNYERTLTRTFNTVSRAINISVGVDLDDPLQVRIIEQGGMRRGMVDLSTQTRQAIYSALAEARDEGLGPREALKRIQEHVQGRNLYPGIWERRYEKEIARGTSDALAREFATDAANRYRAETIARSETKHAQNMSAVTAYQKSGAFDSCLVFDGDGCGWTSHTDPDKAHGKIVSFEDSLTYTLAHPRCVRNFAPHKRER